MHQSPIRLLVVSATAALLFVTLIFIFSSSPTPQISQTTSTKTETSLTQPNLLENLPASLVPTATNGRRLIIIGDIHGMNKPLSHLLRKVSYDATTDHIIAAGDMINKGPHSSAVVRQLMQLNASAVRGNHEDKVLQALSDHRAGRKLSTKKKFLKTGKQLTNEQVTWLAERPLILAIDQLAMHVVHAGLVPGVELLKQDPWAVMNMRSLVYAKEELRRQDAEPIWEEVDEEEEEEEEEPQEWLEWFEDHSDAGTPSDGHDGELWARAWNRRQPLQRLPTRRTVVYGHDARRGLRRGKFTFGLDSACVQGEQLTALVVAADGRDGDISRKLVQVDCERP